ncbi:MobC family replication-relaxation protein [Vibrio sp. S17_S38]|uniref:MobC family replication-relaxation protein n=1 Tax=Vibrio sp. S17_S38 TaxID=2720229 RepID=UPI00193272ED|nr:MobC family replication-relaxation protein [Vibrio sp. S17_S38]
MNDMPKPSFKECRLKGNNREHAVLKFLSQDTFSDFKTLTKITKIKDKGQNSRFIKNMVKKGLILKHEVNFVSNKIALWGITLDGLAIMDEPLLPVFEPSRVRPSTLQHHLDNQFVRLTLESKNCTNWINGDRGEFFKKYNIKHRPDGIITLPSGHNVAIETERTLKRNKQRYQSIMTSHLLGRQKKIWHRVFYVVPTSKQKAALQIMFNDIKFVMINGQPVNLEEKHQKTFKFFTYAELENLSEVTI